MFHDAFSSVYARRLPSVVGAAAPCSCTHCAVLRTHCVADFRCCHICIPSACSLLVGSTCDACRHNDERYVWTNSHWIATCAAAATMRHAQVSMRRVSCLRDGVCNRAARHDTHLRAGGDGTAADRGSQV